MQEASRDSRIPTSDIRQTTSVRRFAAYLAKQLFTMLFKLSLGWALITIIVVPMSFGTYQAQSLWVGLCVSLAVFSSNILVQWLASPGLHGLGLLGSIFQVEILNEVIDEHIWRFTLSGLTTGLATGFGAGLGVSLAESLGAVSFLKGVIIGLTVGLICGSIIPLGFDLRTVLPTRLRAMYQNEYILALGFSVLPSTCLVLSLGLSEAFGGDQRTAAAAGLLIGVLVTFYGSVGMLTLMRNSQGLYPLGVTRSRAMILALAPGSLWGLGWSLFVGLYHSSGAGLLRGALVAIGGLLSVSIGVCCGNFLGYRASKALREILGRGRYSGLNRYLYEMRGPMLIFAVGYVAIALLFAGIFASIQYWSQWSDATRVAFRNVLPGEKLPTDSFWDFVYFSLSTITSLGYSDLQASSPLTKTMVSLEVLAGIGWTVVIFAAIIAYLEPRFSKIWLEEQNKTVARTLIDTILDEDVAMLPEELLASKCTFYDHRNPEGIHDLNTIMDSVDRLRDSIADSEITVSDQIAKGDYVTTHWTASDVQRGSYQHSRSLTYPGLPGQSQEVSGTHLIRLAQGKATEVWFQFRSS